MVGVARQDAEESSLVRARHVHRALLESTLWGAQGKFRGRGASRVGLCVLQGSMLWAALE